jgi:hypothetical protein
MKKIFTLLLLLFSFSGFSQNPAVTLTPSSAAQGTSVTVSLTGGVPGGKYNINLRNSTSSPTCVAGPLATITLAAAGDPMSGSGSGSITIPYVFETSGTCTAGTSTVGTRSLRAQGVDGTVGGTNVSISITAGLPVELVKFDVKNNNKSAMLTWTTASEKDNARFDIEHSTDGRSFAKIGEVKGNGTTYTAVDYSFEHPTPAKGVNYYRLHQIDYDGKNEYSPVRSLILGGKGLIVKNTIAKEAVTVVTDIETPTVVNIYNSAGQQVISNKAVQGEYMLDISALQNGLYIIRTATGDVARFTKL